MIYNYIFVDFNSVSNLIVFIFNRFPCMFVGFNVRVECESYVKNCEDSEVRDWFTSGQPAKSHMRSTRWNLNNLLPDYILQVTSRLSQPVNDP